MFRTKALQQRVGELEAQLAAMQQQRDFRVDELETQLSEARARLSELASTEPLVPGYRSFFGGLWPDAVDRDARPEAKRTSGELTQVQADLIRHWIDYGFVILPQAVPEERVQTLNQATEDIFESGNPKVFVNYYEDGQLLTIPIEARHRSLRVKVVDLHAHLQAARDVTFSPPILDFLRTLFETDPMGFQSLYFYNGSEQPIHQDTAYVGVESRLRFVGCWVALEDVQEGSGELEYYVGSHRFNEFLWNGRAKLMPPNHPAHMAYLEQLHTQAQELGCERRRFLPRRGDVLLWAADLAHGGAPQTKPGLTRRSLVTHFCPVEDRPQYFLETERRKTLRDASGAYYCYAYRWPDEVGGEID